MLTGLHGYFIDRTNDNLNYYYSRGGYISTSSNFSPTPVIIATFLKENNNDISVSLTGVPSGAVYNNNGSENSSYSSITYPWPTSISLYYYSN